MPITLATGLPGPILGPLTTVWSMPDTCTHHILCSTCGAGWQGQRCVSVDGDDEGSANDDTGCWPPRSSGAQGPKKHPLDGWGVYSPGLECPAPYTRACTAVYGEVPEWDVQFMLRPGETAVGCCPENYTCTNRNGNTCVAEATTSTYVATAQCSGSEIVNVGFKVLPDLVTRTEDGVASTKTRTPMLLAPMFQLNYQSSDITDSPPRETSPPDADDQDGGLSIGARAGIAAGVGIAMLLGLLVAWIFYRKRKQSATHEATQHEYDAEDKPSDVGAYPDHRGQLYEVPAVERPVELVAGHMAVELPATHWPR